MNRGVVVVVAFAAALAACADDEPSTTASDASIAVPLDTTPAQPQPGSTPASGGPGSSVGDGVDTAPPGATTSTAGGSDPGTVPAPSLDASGPVGSFAAAVLRQDLSARVVVEVQAAGGAEPRSATVEHVAAVLEDVARKPVSVSAGGAPSDDVRAWTAAELVDEAGSGSRTDQGGGTAVLRLLFVHGTFEGDDSVLGVAIQGATAAVFVDRVEAAGGLLGGSEGIEVAVTTHEVGHLLGLVDIHLATGRGDPEHPGHSRNPGSVMYWAVESDLVGQLLGADPPADFDADDRADLAAIAAGG